MLALLVCQMVRHWVLIPAFVSSNLATPAKYDPLAQSAEHLPFKQGVRSSNLRRVTKPLKTLRFRGFLLYPVKIKTPCLFVHFTKGRVSVFDVQKTII